jgi:dienelactone hydrolase
MCLEDDTDEAATAAWPARPYIPQPGLQPGPVRMVPASSAGAAAGPPVSGVLCLEDFPITYEGYTYPHGKIAYVSGRGPTPVVMVHPNYAGAKQFDYDQACFLAQCGYTAVVVDHYRETNLVGTDGSVTYAFTDRDPRRDLHAHGAVPVGSQGDPLVNQAQPGIARRHGLGAFTAMMGLLSQPKHWRGLMAANLQSAYAHPAVESGLGAAIGYCFGGQACLEQVRNGDELQAVVTFHGLLHSHPGMVDPDSKRGFGRRMTKAEFEAHVDVAPNNYNRATKVLIENGDLDTSVPQEGDLGIDVWKQEMDAAGIDWRFNNHARTPHGFALAPG